MTVYESMLPRGRIGRRHYGLTMLAHFLVVIMPSLTLLNNTGDTANAGYAGEALVLVAVAWLGFCNIAKRLHDRDKSAWYYLLSYVPLANIWLIGIECGLMPGTPGVNRFGPSPTASAMEADLPGARYVPVPPPAFAPPPKPTLNEGIAGAIAAKAARDAQRFGRR